MNTSDVRAYYEHNTRLFLALGAGGRARAIRRAVWAAGVSTIEQALNYSSRLVLEQIACLRRPGEALHVVDLGCGIGGSLFYLASRLDNALRATGVTVSPLQARLAREHAARLGLDARCRFIEADFLALPDLPPADVVFSIEAFIHAPAPARYFEQVARIMRAGGRLALCDDFLSARGASNSLTADERLWVEAFQAGWHVPGLSSVTQVTEMAGRHGFSPVSDRDLTPDLRVLNWPGRLMHALIRLGRAAWLPWAYWRSTVGSLALQQCLKAGLVTYRFVVFERNR